MPPGQAMRPVLPRPFRPGLLPPGVLSKAAGCNPQAAGGSPVAVRKAEREDGALSPISPASEMPISPASEITDSGAQPSAQPEGAKNGSTTERFG
ncbi:unnamed protein product [Prorocentrum cordatum]|uniref:Uncharacterized protein n=1 Tax=Prorocentrum cordatum TaxID=2364126 RepID=A0ABN9TWP4_9DINO|nr:unnamed protein product [Polarella glacialis]